MSSLHSARIPLIVGLAVLGTTLAPLGAQARTLEERVQRQEERAREHEERAQQREQRLQEHEQRRTSSEVQPRGERCQLTIQASTSRVQSGEPVSVSGKLTCPEAASEGEQLVTFERSGGGGERVEEGSAPTEADGSYELTIPTLEQNSIITAHAGHARPVHVVVKVAPRITLVASPAGAQVASDRSQSRAQATFSGTVSVQDAGARVALQSTLAAGEEHWRTLAYGSVDAQGEYSITRSFRVPGERWLRVVVHPRRGDVPAASEPVAYDVPGPQNPALTIESSAPMSTFDQAITISGVAEQAAGEPVQLFARTSGGSFQPVATTTTDESGHYSFTVQPQQRTGYQVREASTQSSTLWQDVSYELTQDALPAAEATAGQPVTFAGTVAPAPSGTRVELEAENASGYGFHTLAGATLEGSGYSIAHTFASAGSYTLRIRVLAAPGAAVTGVAGAPFTLQVAPSA